ncbi:hypothetical protein [Saccharopolyspora sp. NPDC002686]|uniref:hypothetical protein n=1 Tax=Saccharopolyspora sp. NPDC002686 TaxID=3154541 RepID=UPI00331DE974
MFLFEHGFRSFLVMALVAGLVGLLVLIPLWPTKQGGRALLRRWQIAEPADEQIAHAVTYLRRRRFWYPVLFVLIPLVAGLLFEGSTTGFPVFVMILFGGGLLAELLALRPNEHRVREAVLVRRGVLDVVPQWGLVVHAVVAVLALAVASANAAGRGSIVEGSATAFVGVPLCAALVAIVLWAAVARPADGDVELDRVLRVRSGRIALALGTVLQAALLSTACQSLEGAALPAQAPGWVVGTADLTRPLGLAVSVLSIVVWLVLARPPRRAQRTAVAVA